MFQADKKNQGVTPGVLSKYKRELSRLEAYAGSKGAFTVAGLTLFDLGLIKMIPNDLTVSLDSSLSETSYEELHGNRLRSPQCVEAAPSNEALKMRLDLLKTKHKTAAATGD